MADVRLDIAGREYVVTCRDGEEDRLRTLGQMVDEKAMEAGGGTSGLNETRQLLFASLLLADKLADGGDMTPQPANVGGTAEDDMKTAEMLEKMAERLEALANKLEQ